MQSPKSARAEPAISVNIDLVRVVEVGEDDCNLLHDGEHCIGRVTGSCTIGNHIFEAPIPAVHDDDDGVGVSEHPIVPNGI